MYELHGYSIYGINYSFLYVFGNTNRVFIMQMQSDDERVDNDVYIEPKRRFW